MGSIAPHLDLDEVSGQIQLHSRRNLCALSISLLLFSPGPIGFCKHGRKAF